MHSSAAAVLALLSLLLAGGCCSSKPEIAEFRELPLERKLTEFREAYRSGCLHGREVVYLGMISDHGTAAADAMLALAESPTPDFPLRNVIRVAGFVNAGGTELRGHPLHALLRRAATEAPSEEDREAARKVLIEIETKTIVP